MTIHIIESSRRIFFFFFKSSVYYTGRGGRPWYIHSTYLNREGKIKEEEKESMKIEK